VAPRLATARRVRLDVVGTAVLCASVVASLYPLLFARDAGWPWWMLALLCVGLIGFVCFWKVEARLGARRGQPLVDVASLRERAFATGLAATFALYLGITSFLLVLTLYLQSGLRMSAPTRRLDTGAVGRRIFGVLAACDALDRTAGYWRTHRRRRAY